MGEISPHPPDSVIKPSARYIYLKQSLEGRRKRKGNDCESKMAIGRERGKMKEKVGIARA